MTQPSSDNRSAATGGGARPSRRRAGSPRRKRGGRGGSWGARHRLGLLTAALTVAAVAVLLLTMALDRVGSGEPVWVRFDRATAGQLTDGAVRDTLKSRLGKADGMKVYLMWRLQGGRAKGTVGAYRFGGSQTAFMAARRLAKGRQTPVTLTFNNVRTMDALAERIGRSLDVAPADFLAACDSVLTPLGFSRAEWPAAFVPDSYEVYYTVGPAALVGKLLKARNAFWNAERTVQASRLGLTPVGVATVASIVEEETAKADERPRVARLYLNRLNRDMPLQADPTVKFAIGDFSIRRITGRMLQTPSPYNTYRRRGLPPGPIRIADARTLDAVLNAPSHDFLYMCAREDFSGYHNFATDYAAHQANARRYQAALDARNIH